MRIRGNEVTSHFSPLIGQIVWFVRRGWGNSLTLEFGRPYMRIREPVKSNASSSQVKALLARRKVTICGEWHFWIECGSWDISLQEFRHISNHDLTVTDTDAKLAELDGERLVAINEDLGSAILQLEFDLGSILSVRPANISGDPVWSLFKEDEHLITYNNDGSIILNSQSL